MAWVGQRHSCGRRSGDAKVRTPLTAAARRGAPRLALHETYLELYRTYSFYSKYRFRRERGTRKIGLPSARDEDSGVCSGGRAAARSSPGARDAPDGTGLTGLDTVVHTHIAHVPQSNIRSPHRGTHLLSHHIDETFDASAVCEAVCRLGVGMQYGSRSARPHVHVQTCNASDRAAT